MGDSPPFSAPVASSDAQFDRVVVYDADVMCTQDAVPLSRCDLILMAMLIGGDYDEVSISAYMSLHT